MPIMDKEWKSKNKNKTDVAEERSVFIIGIPKLSTEDTIKDMFKNFGEIKHVRFCINRDTGAPKGTGFVEFKTKEAATECLEASGDAACKDQFKIDGLSLKCMKALPKKELTPQGDKKAVKDKRNIYLVREGVIRDGTRAGEGVSKFDLALRVEREKIKRRLLANLHCFVSPTRLYCSNIPVKISEQDLRSIFQDHAPKQAVMNECRIMKHQNSIGDDGLPKSKGFAFLNFTVHEHALAALRAVNNNPLIFEKKRRPIVEFSIENQAALNARKRRQERSKENLNKSVEKEDTKERAPVELNNAEYVGGRAEKGMKMSSHIGVKKSKKSGKITRNTINNRVRKRQKTQKKRVEKDKNKKRIEKLGRKAKKGKKVLANNKSKK